MERDELIGELSDVIRGPLVLLADEIRQLIAVYREHESEAKAAAGQAKTVAKLHAAEIQAARGKGAADALAGVVRVLDNATRKGR